MILLTLAAIAAAQWTGPHTEEYRGPGFFCGGGYAIRLGRGERALILPQGAGAPGARVIVSGHNVSIWSGAERDAGRLVTRYGGTAVREQDEGGDVSYLVSDQTDFALRLTSDGFRGFRRDGWFFTRANFSSAAENRVRCLAAISY